MRSSIEGLNQEIEGLVLKSSGNPNDPDHQVEDKVHLILTMACHFYVRLIILLIIFILFILVC